MQLAGEQIAVLRGVGGLTAVRVVGEEAAAAAAAALCHEESFLLVTLVSS